MARKCCLLLLTILLLVLIAQASENGVHSAVFHSPKIALGAGSVVNKFYDDLDFPRGHIAIKEFRAELVDVLGKPVPVRETYVHHWTVSRYYTLRNGSGDLTNSGRCEYYCEQYFGSGSESRGTHGYVPDPYGIVVGNPADVPEGYAERWYLNVHAIDTRGVVDKLGCIECGCNHYNVTVEETGGAFCCYDEAQCRLRDGFLSIKRSLFMRYTVKWVDWVDTIVPVRIYVLELSDTAKNAVTATERRSQAEHKDEPCTLSGVSGSGCLHTKRTSIAMTKGGYLVYGVGHQYPGGIGSTLYGEDGRKICSSMAIYGEGKETGNEAGYITGMSSCYPQSGTVKISNGESVIFETTYNSSLWHSGVLGNFYILLADEAASVSRWFSFSPARPSFSDSTKVHKYFLVMQEKLRLHMYSWGLVLVAMAIAAVAGISYRRRNEIDEEEYKAMYYEHVAIA